MFPSHDTDSVFVKGVKNEEEADLLAERINLSYDDFVEPYGLSKHRFEIEFEEYVEIGIFSGKKKKYALKTNHGYKFKGYELRRSNVSRIGQEIQQTVLERILEGAEKSEIKKYINVKKKYIRESASLEEIGVPATLSKNLDSYGANSQHLRAARYSNKYLGRVFGAKDKLLLVFIKRKPPMYPKTNVIALEYGDKMPDEFVIDIDEHIEKSVGKLTDPIFEAIGWDMNISNTIWDI